MTARSLRAKPLLQRLHPGADRLQRGLHGLGRHDAGNADLGGLLLAREQDFVQALARADAGEGDLDVAAGLQPARAG